MNTISKWNSCKIVLLYFRTVSRSAQSHSGQGTRNVLQDTCASVNSNCLRFASEVQASFYKDSSLKQICKQAQEENISPFKSCREC